MMKESKFVRTKIVVGYVLIALIGLTAMIYVWRQTGALLEPDHSQQELRRRRGLVNQTLYHLYEAETYGQMLVAGYASYENRYKRELRLVRECIEMCIRDSARRTPLSWRTTIRCPKCRR